MTNEDVVVSLVIDGASGDANLEGEMALLLQALFEVFKKKQASYGPGNIAGFGEKGCLIRAYDKMQRLKRLTWDNVLDPLQDETIDDTLLDLADYALIMLLVRHGHWPTLRKE